MFVFDKAGDCAGLWEHQGQERTGHRYNLEVFVKCKGCERTFWRQKTKIKSGSTRGCARCLRAMRIRLKGSSPNFYAIKNEDNEYLTWGMKWSENINHAKKFNGAGNARSFLVLAKIEGKPVPLEKEDFRL